MDWNTVTQIQVAYLEMLDTHYVEERAEESMHGAGMGEKVLIGRSARSREERLRRYLTECHAFWDQYQGELEAALDANDGTRICLWGDSGVQSLLPRMGLYFDVVLLPDSFYTYAPLPEEDRFPHDYDHCVLDWLLLVDALRPALVVREGYPLLVCFPQRAGPKERSEEVEALVHSAGTLASTAFQRLLRLSDPPVPPQEIYDLLDRVKISRVNRSGTLATIERMMSPVLAGHGLPASREKGFNSGLLHRFRNRRLREGDLRLLFIAFGSQLYLAEARQFNCAVLGADDVVGERLEHAIRIRSRLLVDESKQRGLSEERVVAHSFQSGMPWLSRLTLEDCLKLRSNLLFSEVKDLFRVERSRLRNARPDELAAIGAQVESNVERALHEHQLRVESAMHDLRKATRNSSISMMAGVGLGLASLAFPQVGALNIGGLLLGALFGTDSAYGVYRARRDRKLTLDQARQSPVSVLLRARKYELGQAAGARGSR